MNASEVQPDQNGGATETPQKKGKAKRERKRRDYAGELADLKARVDAALRLLNKVDAGADAKLLTAAVEMLRGD